MRSWDAFQQKFPSRAFQTSLERKKRAAGGAGTCGSDEWSWFGPLTNVFLPIPKINCKKFPSRFLGTLQGKSAEQPRPLQAAGCDVPSDLPHFLGMGEGRRQLGTRIFRMHIADHAHQHTRFIFTPVPVACSSLLVPISLVSRSTPPKIYPPPRTPTKTSRMSRRHPLAWHQRFCLA